MTFDPPAAIKLSGELARRLELNYHRLHAPEHYSLDKAFRPADYDWPGDWEGRLILALTMTSALRGDESENLAAIIKALPDHLNDAGYFGVHYTDGMIDEQQLSSHGWVLRALSEYYLRHPDPRVSAIANAIIDNLVLPLRGHYSRYPIGLDVRRPEGGAMGVASDRCCGNWRLSSDIGCAFILMDGVVQAAEVFRRPECHVLIEEMLARLDAIDLPGGKAQTHASLTAARGALRYYLSRGYRPGLEQAVKIYGQYRRLGMTEHFANFNWFGRPDWTEPCAIVDSVQLAVALWRATGDPSYLRDAHCFWHTGVERAQRPNGGFGGDSCPRGEESLLRVKFYEAYWCCTMRGGEGLYRRADAIASCADGVLSLTFPAAASLTFPDGREVTLETDYPYSPACRITLSGSAAPLTALRFFLPPGIDLSGLAVCHNGKPLTGKIDAGFLNVTGTFSAGDTIEIKAAFVVEKRPSLNPESKMFGWWHGPLMLGWNPAAVPCEPLRHEGRARYLDAVGTELTPLNEFAFLTGLPDTNECFAADAAAMARTTRQILTA